MANHLEIGDEVVLPTIDEVNSIKGKHGNGSCGHGGRVHYSTDMVIYGGGHTRITAVEFDAQGSPYYYRVEADNGEFIWDTHWFDTQTSKLSDTVSAYDRAMGII